jgi:hypothetical protein
MGREKMQHEFDEEIIVKHYIEVVKEAIKQKGEKL